MFVFFFFVFFLCFCFFFNDTATTEIYTLSLHDALPICIQILSLTFDYRLNFCVITKWLKIAFVKHCHLYKREPNFAVNFCQKNSWNRQFLNFQRKTDRKSTRLNSSHSSVSRMPSSAWKKKKKQKQKQKQQQKKQKKIAYI